ncbi:hypothetical protein [Pseudoduganella aquatica]|uniref:Uncharacterized protein n=1 Tax=Pseudoduganella aquatica TaxID=2660641 RepID=A0A7X4KPP5_9BURK|nr:hypothetical protein [Pseudoduganella aquatica]MYN10392.1 hypothetical protein [Pseudoduganella aquatica]
MSTISPLSSRQLQPASLSLANQQTDSKNLRVGNSSLLEKAQNDLVSLSKNGIDLQQRVDSLGNSTVDLAQNLLGSFAQQLFGDSAKGATVSFDSVSLESSSSFAAGVQQSQGAGGSSKSAAFSLTESSHFLGKGTITTADGSTFDFEVEVQYDYALQASASQSTAADGAADAAKAARSAADPLPAVEFPDIKFPGSLQDLFRLFDKPLKSDVVQEDKKQPGEQQKLGTLSLRLLNLVNSTEQLDTYGPQTGKSKAVAHAYGTQETPANVLAKAPGSVPEAAAAAAASAAEAAPAAPVIPAAETEPQQAAA